MSEIYMNIKSIRNINHSLSITSSKLSVERKKLGMIRWMIPEEILLERNTGERLDNVISRLERVEKNLDEVYKVTLNSIGLYLRAEEKLEKRATELESDL